MSERRHYTKPYPEAFRRDAVALVHSSGRPIREIAVELGVSSESLRLWCKRAEIDAGVPSFSTAVTKSAAADREAKQ